MDRDENFCVSTKFVLRVVREHHEAHTVVKRLMNELALRYSFPPTSDFRAYAERVRRECLVCQACEPPTYALREEVHMTPVPDLFMASVRLDIFSMPPHDVAWTRIRWLLALRGPLYRMDGCPPYHQARSFPGERRPLCSSIQIGEKSVSRALSRATKAHNSRANGS